ncbi:hypothetical protein [Granulicella sp. 5B5]|uniref:hypothetical protein n=1 Tax=Granulicella sp. 5B5 TaxID=1617967 RepID=UPI0015F6F5F1|nr:hypothetical protein [Granulicella sp. 5B5]
MSQPVIASSCILIQSTHGYKVIHWLFTNGCFNRCLRTLTVVMKSELERAQSASAETTSAADWPDLARRELLNRILISPTFARSERLCTLLTYVCDMAFKGREAEINEQRIGHAVFGRLQDYDSSIDGIVRTQASRLRQRLELYFQHEGAGEPVCLVIPRGGYVPVFEPRVAAAVPRTTEQLPHLPAMTPPLPGVTPAERQQSTQRLPWFLCGLLFVVVVVLGIREHRLSLAASAPVPQHPLWSHLLLKGQPTLVVPADSGLVLFHNISGRSIGLNDYLQGEYRAQPPETMGYRPDATLPEWLSNLADRRYTSIVDLNAVDQLERLSERYQSELQVRYARDVRPNDLKSGNTVLIGASEANPWVELYERNMNFVFHNDYKANVFSVINRSPKPGEPKQWDSAWNDPQRRVFCLVAYVPNLANNGNALIVEGTSMSGTEGAWDFVSDDAQLLPFLRRIQRPDGSIPHFELLLGNQNMNASAVQSRLLAWRVID